VNECDLKELLEKQHVVLIHFRTFNYQCGEWSPEWLGTSFVRDGNPLVRRQELPAEAKVTAEKAVLEVDKVVKWEGGVGVISHGWLAPQHPDPQSKRRDDIKQLWEGLTPAAFVFWDFLSLWQVPRTHAEKVSFEVSLASMHVIYTHPKWNVYRILTIPEHSLNGTAYLARGWCFFESGVSIVGARALVTICDGKRMDHEKSPVPLPPVQFAAEVKELHFTSKRTDVDTVIQLYSHIFPKLAEHDSLIVTAWEDREVEKLLTVLPELKGLKSVSIHNDMSTCTATISNEVIDKLETALKGRGGNMWIRERAYGGVMEWKDGVQKFNCHGHGLGDEQARELLQDFPGLQIALVNPEQRQMSESVVKELEEALQKRGGYLKYEDPSAGTGAPRVPPPPRRGF